jgi:hypothetical protein
MNKTENQVSKRHIRSREEGDGGDVLRTAGPSRLLSFITLSINVSLRSLLM